jgi:transketolase
MRGNVAKGASAETEWKAAMEAYKAKYPTEYAEFTQLIR